MSRASREADPAPKRRILVVEDEPGLVLTLSDRLRSEGHEVEVAIDGDTGFEAARAGAFDLIVLDIALPKRSGLDVCRDLRREGVDTPILIEPNSALPSRSGWRTSSVLPSSEYTARSCENGRSLISADRSSRARSSSAPSRAASVSNAPSSASWRATRSPRPRDPPVMITD